MGAALSLRRRYLPFFGDGAQESIQHFPAENEHHDYSDRGSVDGSVPIQPEMTEDEGDNKNNAGGSGHNPRSYQLVMAAHELAQQQTEWERQARLHQAQLMQNVGDFDGDLVQAIGTVHNQKRDTLFAGEKLEHVIVNHQRFNESAAELREFLKSRNARELNYRIPPMATCGPSVSVSQGMGSGLSFGATSPPRSVIQSHALRGPEKKKGRVQCICGQFYKTMPILRRHVMTSTTTGMFACPLCSKIYHFYSQLTRHASSAHKTELERKKQGCRECARLANNRHQLVQHRRIAHRPLEMIVEGEANTDYGDNNVEEQRKVSAPRRPISSAGGQKRRTMPPRKAAAKRQKVEKPSRDASEDADDESTSAEPDVVEVAAAAAAEPTVEETGSDVSELEATVRKTQSCMQTAAAATVAKFRALN